MMNLTQQTKLRIGAIAAGSLFAIIIFVCSPYVSQASVTHFYSCSDFGTMTAGSCVDDSNGHAVVTFNGTPQSIIDNTGANFDLEANGGFPWYLSFTALSTYQFFQLSPWKNHPTKFFQNFFTHL